MDLKENTQSARLSAQAKNHMRRIGYNPGGHRLWEAWEDEIVMKHRYDVRKAAQELDRTLTAIRSRRRLLGCTLYTTHRWTGADRVKFRKLYPTASTEEMLTAFPFATHCMLMHAAQRFKVFKKKRPFAQTGNPLLDQIRTRCFALNMSLKDLDAMISQRFFYSRSNWRNCPWKVQTLVEAVEALGGRVTIVWDD